MSRAFFAFGEILWDCLPAGRFPGGAPLNVAAHLAQLGASAAIISAVGTDESGDELIDAARARQVGVDAILRAPHGVPTGTVQAKLDASGNATYEIAEPVAWDSIVLNEEVRAQVAGSSGLIFGSLAMRSAQNREQLQRLLDLPAPRKYFDVNLRAPYTDFGAILRLAQHADVLKLNVEEAYILAGFVQGVGNTGHELRSGTGRDELSAVCSVLARATGTSRICVTAGAEGAMFWDAGDVLHAAAPPIKVVDTIGAGDAFMAALALGLTNGIETQRVLKVACELGAFVASQRGATPEFREGDRDRWSEALEAGGTA